MMLHWSYVVSKFINVLRSIVSGETVLLDFERLSYIFVYKLNHTMDRPKLTTNWTIFGGASPANYVN